MSTALVGAACTAAAVGLLGGAVRPALGPAPRRHEHARPAAAPHHAEAPGIGNSATRRPAIVARRARVARLRAAAELPDALELVVLAVRAGHLPAAAIRASLAHLPDRIRPAFAEVIARVDSGRRFADAITVLAEQLGDDALVLADSLAAADRYGLPLAPVLDRLAAEARQQRARRTATIARQLPIRLAAPLVMCTLPSFVLLAVVPLLLAALSSLRW